MKVCVINNLYKPYSRGGAERVTETIVKGLEKAGHKVVVVASRPIWTSKKQRDCHASLRSARNDSAVYTFYPWNIISYYNLHKLPKALRLLWHLIDMFNIQSYFKVKSILKKEKPDVVMTHNLMGVGFLTPLAIKRCGIKHVHTLHDIQLIHPSGLLNVGNEYKVDSVFARMYASVCRKLFNSPEMVISPSQWLMEMHKQRGFFKNSKCVVLNNPVQSSRDCHAFAGAPARNDMVFLYVGQIEKHKGVELLIKTFAELKSENTQLWIVGSGTYNLQLIPQFCGISLGLTTYNLNNIQFLGKKNSAEVQKLMSEADCLVVPSLCYENAPAVITEAMSVGLPVIGANIGGIPEILEDGCGITFEPGDVTDLLVKMKWAMQNKALLQEIGKRGREKIKEQRVEGHVDKILKL